MRELTKVVANIEEDYRHDLAVHLYQAHLLHQVNLSFPARIWTAWPLPRNRMVDPMVEKTYEGLPFEPEMSRTLAGSEAAPIGPDFPSDARHLMTRPHEGLYVNVRSGHSKPSDPQAALRNEIFFMLQRKIRSRGGDEDANQQFIKNAAVALTSKVEKILERMEGPPIPRNWQDIMINMVLAQDSSTKPEIAESLRVYAKLHAFFSKAYSHEYDLVHFANGRAPPFNVRDHLLSLRRSADLRPEHQVGKSPMAELRQFQMQMKTKQKVFYEAVDNAAARRQLSYDPNDLPKQKYNPRNGDLRGLRRLALAHSALDASAYIQPVRKKRKAGEGEE